MGVCPPLAQLVTPHMSARSPYVTDVSQRNMLGSGVRAQQQRRHVSHHADGFMIAAVPLLLAGRLANSGRGARYLLPCRSSSSSRQGPQESTKKARTEITIHGACAGGGARQRRGRRKEKDEQQHTNVGMDQRHAVDLASLSARVDSGRVVAESSVMADSSARDDSGRVEARCPSGLVLVGRPPLVELMGR